MPRQHSGIEAQYGSGEQRPPTLPRIQEASSGKTASIGLLPLSALRLSGIARLLGFLGQIQHWVYHEGLVQQISVSHCRVRLITAAVKTHDIFKAVGSPATVT
jgi:hypothetical protein